MNKMNFKTEMTPAERRYIHEEFPRLVARITSKMTTREDKKQQRTQRNAWTRSRMGHSSRHTILF